MCYEINIISITYWRWTTSNSSCLLKTITNYTKTCNSSTSRTNSMTNVKIS